MHVEADFYTQYSKMAIRLDRRHNFGQSNQYRLRICDEERICCSTYRYEQSHGYPLMRGICLEIKEHLMIRGASDERGVLFGNVLKYLHRFYP